MMDFPMARAVAAPETLLAVAVLSQAHKDITAASGDVRRAAQAFWQSPEALQVWAEVLGLDIEALMAAVGRRQSQ